jgi:predicted ATPase
MSNTLSHAVGPYIFISYASVDRLRVQSIVDALQATGVRVWLDQQDIVGGTQYGGEISDAIRGCCAFVVMCSPASLASRNVKQEVMLAWKHQRPYMPLLLEPIVIPPDLEYWLEGAQWIEVFDPTSGGWLPKVLHALARIDRASSDAAVDQDAVTTGRAPVGPSTSTARFDQQAFPVEITPLFGRERDVDDARKLLERPDVRLVTFSGPGGVGKTRLCLRVAAELRDQFANGIVVVELAPISDPLLVVTTIAQTLGVRETPGLPLLEGLLRGLRERELLLVLDNFEQVIGAAPLVPTLLAAAPKLKVLVTSRVLLHVSGEHDFAVLPLAVPSVDWHRAAQKSALDVARALPAVALFVDRATAVKRGFELTDANVAPVVAICQRLDGLPLAIELAAARSKLLSPQALLDRLARRLPLLTGGPRDLPERQRTIRDTTRWSYDLLPPDEQHLFRSCSVFSGGWTLEAVEAIVEDYSDVNIDVLDGMSSLVDKSLVTQHNSADAEPRFGMLETIREFGIEQLTELGELDQLRAIHAAYVTALAGQVEPHLLGPGQSTWLARLETEYDNIRLALAWLLDHDPVQAAVLAGRLWRFWESTPRTIEAWDWLTRVVEQRDGASADARAKVLLAAGLCARLRGDYDQARAWLTESVELAKVLNNHEVGLAALYGLALVALWESWDTDLAGHYCEQALTRFPDPRHRYMFSRILSTQGLVVRERGEYDRAQRLFEEALELERDAGDENRLALTLGILGQLLFEHRDDFATARDCFYEQIARAYSNRLPYPLASGLENLAEIAQREGQWEREATLFGAAGAVRASAGLTVSALDQRMYDEFVVEMRSRLGDDAFHNAWEIGAAMSMAEAFAYALAGDEMA